MNTGLFNTGLRLAAYDQQSAVYATSLTHQHIRDDAIIMSVTAMAGEPDGLWACCAARATAAKPTGQQITISGDPRNYNAHIQALSKLDTILNTHIDRSQNHPQIVVATPGVWDHLTAVARRGLNSTNEQAKHCAELITWIDQQQRRAGAQLVIILSDLLNFHFAAPIPPNETESLDAWATWLHTNRIERQLGDDPNETVLAPQGEHDLVTPVARWGREPDGPSRTIRLAPITRTLTKLLTARHQRTQLLLHRFQQTARPVTQSALQAATLDTQAWNRAKQSWATNHRPYATGARGVTSTYLIQEARQQTWLQQQIWEDDLIAASIADGTVITGVITNSTATQVEIETEQNMVRARPGEQFGIRQTDHTGTIKTVTATNHATTRIILTTKTLWPTDPTPVTLATPPEQLGSVEGNAAATINRAGSTWTHNPNIAPPK